MVADCRDRRREPSRTYADDAVLQVLGILGDPVENAAAFSDVVISLKPGSSVDHVSDQSIDAVVIDPPYGANVYAELADFFYVWLKRTAGLISPELFTRRMTDKQSEAVANPQLFAGKKGAAALATRDYTPTPRESEDPPLPNGAIRILPNG